MGQILRSNFIYQ